VSAKKARAQLRLDRLLVERGWGPRREAQRLIRLGFVIAEGEQLRSPELKVSSAIKLLVDGEPCEPPPRLIAYHKPLWVLSTKRDPWGRAGLDYALPERLREALQPVGRLDAETTGLLLFSSDGALTQQLLHPRRAVERSYLAAVSALPEGLEATLKAGVETSLGTFSAELLMARSAQASLLDEALRSALEALGRAEEASAELCVRVREGKHRMVRRLLHNAGASVIALHRVSFAGIELGELSPGAWRVVSDEELSALTLALNESPEARDQA